MLDKGGDLPSDPTSGTDEHVDLTEPGTYEVYVVQYALPKGVISQPYTLHTWQTGKDTRPDRPVTVTPAEQRVSAGVHRSLREGDRRLAPGNAQRADACPVRTPVGTGRVQ
ncbi:hypothetical protein [Streptomyces sp. S.PNR 29]|uniref:hypothetical protein n=1 Tax=Streptomyces sp. S.PNR 29 TaxID=2973805 RepID=UPI0025B0E331|nr:hypothetical protein [Streptomyces sp. S.PNR 29]MDN0199832.1 hypothetical protein [Streptomyces sp. S.PNR 29]